MIPTLVQPAYLPSRPLCMRCCFAFALALLTCISYADLVPVRVKVVASGHPVANTAVAAQWLPKVPELTLPLLPVDALQTNAEGVAEGNVEGTYPIVLSAFDHGKKLGGFVAIYEDTKDAVITLAPMQAVQFDYSFTGTDQPLGPAWVEAQLVVSRGKAGGDTVRPAYVFPLTRETLYLPPGSYRFWPGAESADASQQWTEVPTTPGVFHTPKFVLTATKVAVLAGKPAPELAVVGAMNIGSKVKLSDFKGKWVLIDFWGTWCAPCREEMPGLIDFYNQNKAKRAQFEVLSLHDSTQATVASLKAEVAKAVKGQWKGKALPFPVLLDQGGKTVEAYGIKGFPTHVLIDPQGRIVDGGSLEMLKTILSAGGPP